MTNFLDSLVQNVSGLSPASVSLMALAGLIVGIAPGSYPLLAVGAGLSTGSKTGGGGARSRTLFLASGFVLGIALVDAAMGALFGLLGFVVLRTLAVAMMPLYFALSLVLLVMGLALLRIINVNFRVLYAAPRAVKGFWSALALGIPFGLSTCPACTPLVLPVMLAAGASGDAMMGATLLFVFGLARGVPIVLVGAVADLLPRFFPVMFWMPRIERVGGGLLIIAAAAFAYQGGVYAGWFPPVPI